MRAPRVADSSPPVDPRSSESATLVLAAQGGDRAAFGRLYERYARLVHAVLLANAERDDVQDLVQEVFLRALRRLDTLREPAAFGGWIATMARNEARMHHRSARQFEPLSDELVEATAAPAPASTDVGPTVDDVMRALRALPERYREPLMLRLAEQLGGEEIASRLGLSHGTVRVYLHHGFRLLREQLGAIDV